MFLCVEYFLGGYYLKKLIKKKKDIKYWKKKIPQLMFKLKKCLPSTFFNAQEQYLIHQVEKIKLCGPI